MNRYPMKPYMDEMATHGRYGDSMLVHMNPAEVQGIASLAPGGQLTINPVTGQPEAFLPILASLLGSWGGSAALTGLGASATSAGLSSTLAGAIGSGIATTAVTGDIKRGLVSGLIGAGTGGAFGGAEEAVKGTEALQAGLTETAATGADVVTNLGSNIDKLEAGLAGELQGQAVADANIARLVDSGVDVSQIPKFVSGSEDQIAQLSQLKAGQSAIQNTFSDDMLAKMTPEQIQKLSPAWQGAKSFGSDMMGAKALIPTALGAGQLEQMDMEDQWKAAQMQTELDRQAELGEARGNLQRGYAAAQPNAMTGPSPYRSYLSSYTPDYEYANAGGVVSLMGGGPVKKYQAGGEFDPEVYAQSLPANIREIYLKSNAGGYDSLTEEEAATLSNYYSSAGAGLVGGKGGVGNWPIQTGTQEVADTTPEEPAPPALPTSGYMRDPNTGAIVYLGGTRPGAGTPTESASVNPSNAAASWGGKGGMNMNMLAGGAGNPAYGSIDPVTIQANLRGQYSTTPPSGYALGFEPEFNYFQNDPFNVEVPWRGYYPKAFGPMQSGPYFHSTINMPGYLNQIGDYYKELAGYPVPEGKVPQVEPTRVVDPPLNKGDETPDDPIVEDDTPDTPSPVVDTTPQGSSGDIVVGNYQGGAKPPKRGKTIEEMVTFNPETGMWEGIYWDEGDKRLFAEAPAAGMTVGGPPVEASELNEAARQSVISQIKAHSEKNLMRKHPADGAWWDYYSEAFGYVNPYTGKMGAASEAEAAKLKERARLEAEKQAAKRPNEADDKGLRSLSKRSPRPPSGGIETVAPPTTVAPPPTVEPPTTVAPPLTGEPPTTVAPPITVEPPTVAPPPIVQPPVLPPVAPPPTTVAPPREGPPLEPPPVNLWQQLAGIAAPPREGAYIFPPNMQIRPNKPSGGRRPKRAAGGLVEMEEGGDVMLETSLGDVSTPAGGIAGVETEFVKPQAPAPQISEQDVMMVAQAVLGRIDQPDAIINLFIQKYGVENFLALRQQILASAVGTQPQAEGMVQGQGGGMDDQVMGMIGDQQPVAVSPGEYIVPADVVSGLGDGSSDAGAEELDQMMDNVRKARQGGSTTQPPAINAQRMMP